MFTAPRRPSPVWFVYIILAHKKFIVIANMIKTRFYTSVWPLSGRYICTLSGIFSMMITMSGIFSMMITMSRIFSMKINLSGIFSMMINLSMIIKN